MLARRVIFFYGTILLWLPLPANFIAQTKLPGTVTLLTCQLLTKVIYLCLMCITSYYYFFFHIQGSLLAIFMSAGFMQLLSKSSDVKILLLTVNLFRATQEILLENVKKLIKKEIYGNTCFIIIYL